MLRARLAAHGRFVARVKRRCSELEFFDDDEYLDEDPSDWAFGGMDHRRRLAHEVGSYQTARAESGIAEVDSDDSDAVCSGCDEFDLQDALGLCSGGAAAPGRQADSDFPPRPQPLTLMQLYRQARGVCTHCAV
jgi:hypothetical protein